MWDPYCATSLIKHRPHVCLDVGAVCQLGEQLLPELEVLVQVGHHGQVHEGGLPRGLQEGGQLELLHGPQSEMSIRSCPPITAHLVIRLAECDGQGRVSGECLEDGRGVAERGEQSGGAVPALVGQEGGVDLANESRA